MERDQWTAGILRDPQRRASELRRASLTETVFSMAAAAFVLLAVWALVGDVESVGGLAPARAGGMALLCLIGCLTIAAGGGIKRRLILLAQELDSPDRH
jgi:hypothetical protein